MKTKTMRLSVVALFLCLLVGCTALNTLLSDVSDWFGDTNGTIVQYATYYENFSTGVKAALPVLAAMFVTAEPYIGVITASLVLLDKAVADLRTLANKAALASEAVQTKLREIQTAIDAINDAVQSIKSMQSDQVATAIQTS